MTSANGGLPSLSSLTKSFLKAPNHTAGNSLGNPFSGSSSGRWDPLGGMAVSATAAANARVTAALQAEKAKQGSGGASSGILGSIVGFGGNLVNDAVNTAVGMPAGIIHMAEHPIAGLQAIAHDYYQRYDPLFNGNFGQFFHQVDAHPLSYLLDATMLASGGMGAAAKLGQVGRIADAAAAGRIGSAADAARLSGFEDASAATKARAAGQVQKYRFGDVNPESPMKNQLAAKLNNLGTASQAEVAPGLKTDLSAHPWARTRQRAFLKLQKSKLIPDSTPGLGIESRIGRMTQNNAYRTDALAHARQADYIRSLKKVKGPVLQTALHNMIRGIHPLDEVKFLKGLPSLVSRDKAIELLSHPQVSKLYDNALKAYNDPKFLDTLRTTDPAHAKDIFNLLGARVKHEAVAGDMTAQMIALGHISPEEALARTALHYKIIHGDRAISTRGAGGKFQRTMIADANPADILKHMHERGNFVPLYTPDALPGEIKSVSNLAKGSKGQLVSEGMSHANEAMNPGQQMVQSAKTVADSYGAMQKREMLKGMAVHSGTSLPKGHVWLSENPAEALKAFHNAVVNGDKGAAMNAFENVLKQGHVPTHGLSVPKSAVKAMQVEAEHAMGRTGIISKFTKAWKYGILGLRPGFLRHNVLGNELLYHGRQGLGLRGYAGALKGMEAIRSMFPEHRATFFETENMLNPTSKIGKVMKSAFTGVHNHEQWLRGATLYNEASKIPEIRAAIKSVRNSDAAIVAKGGRLNEHADSAFTRGLQKALKNNPALHGHLSSAMDDVLGNYRNYNSWEQGMRDLVPFYGWNRHAMRSYTRMMLDRPGTAAMLTQIGKQGHGMELKGVPEFMKSYVGLPKALQHLGLGNYWDSHGLNPYSAATDTVKAAKELINGKSGATGMADIMSAANPMALDIFQTLTGQNAQTGAPLPKTFLSNQGLLGNTLGQVFENFPQVKLASHILGTDKAPKGPGITPTGRLQKPKQHMLGHSTEILGVNNLGIDTRQVNVKQARAMQSRLLAKQNGTNYHYAKPRGRKSSSSIFGFGSGSGRF